MSHRVGSHELVDSDIYLLCKHRYQKGNKGRCYATCGCGCGCGGGGGGEAAVLDGKSLTSPNTGARGSNETPVGKLA